MYHPRTLRVAIGSIADHADKKASGADVIGRTLRLFLGWFEREQ